MIEQLPGLDSLPAAPTDTQTIFDRITEPSQETTTNQSLATEQPVIEQSVQSASGSVDLDPAPGESPSAKHFKAIRDLKAKAERERDEALRRSAELEHKLNSNNVLHGSPTQVSEADEISIGNDELAEGKHLKAVVSKMHKLEKQLQQYQSQSSSSYVESRLKMDYPDIEQVVSKENIEILGIQYPELAATINESSDLYKKAVSAYTLIKKLGIQPEDSYAPDRVRAAVNAAKPRPLTSVNPQQGDSPLSHANAFANGLTDELKSSLLKEMMQARR